MSTPKFDEQDRRKVISDIERHFGIALSRIGNRRKALCDESGKTYWVLGGYDDWHGIPADMMNEEESRDSNGMLIIARRFKSRIDVFAGELKPLIVGKSHLSHTAKGDYQFNIRVRGNHLFIREIPDYALQKLGSADYSDDQKSSDQKLDEIRALVEKMSPEEKRDFLKQLSDGSET